MKKGIIILILVLLLGIGGIVAIYYFADDTHNLETSLSEPAVTPEIKAYQKLASLPIKWTDVQTTAELKELFKEARYDKMPRIFVRRFPDDFASQGNEGLLATVLLPHLLRQNQLLQAERAAFLSLADKVNKGIAFTPAEDAFWNDLVLKYEVLNPDKIGQKEVLFRRIDRLSPSLAIAQSLEATNMGKEDLDAPFDVRRWNDQKQYDFVRYPDLSAAVADYALELNRGYSYLKFHMLRSYQSRSKRPLRGRVFARGLGYYKIEDPAYVQKLLGIFDWFQFAAIDEAAFVKE